MTGLRKAAILLVRMGKEYSSRVLANLSEGEVEEVSAEMRRLGQLEAGGVGDVIDEFYALATTKHAGAGGMAYARELLEASLGSERATLLLDRLQASLHDMPVN